jgi:Zn-dependent peptidase ImmA (M78 family)
MAKNFLTQALKETIEIKFDVKILLFEQYQDDMGYTEEDVYNYAAYAGNEIFLGKYDDPKIEILCLFHELGHITCNKKKVNSKYFCYLSMEAVAWEMAIKLIDDYNILFDFTFDFNNYNSNEMKFMREQFKTYFNSEYNEFLR